MSQPHLSRALELLSNTDRWLTIKWKSDGQKFYVVPGSSGKVTWTNLAKCSCFDSEHRIAVEVHVASVNTQLKRRPTALRQQQGKYAPLVPDVPSPLQSALS